jgi:hypothetical protein
MLRYETDTVMDDHHDLCDVNLMHNVLSLMLFTTFVNIFLQSV